MNKRGFTLVEILAVIVLIGALAFLVVPNLVDTFTTSIDKTMQIQENRLEEAALSYLEDYCKTPINKSHHCLLTRNIDYTFSGNIPLSTLISAEYIDVIKLRQDTCEGYVAITNNKAKAYLSCGETYTTSGYSS